MPSLKLVNDQQPTAELRPSTMKQTDEEDLMPYDVLNKIERYMIRDKMSLDDIIQFVSNDFPAISSEKGRKIRP